MSVKRSLKGLFRHSIALLAFFLGIAWFRARSLRTQAPLVRILLVHHIKDAGRFERMIREIARHTNPISYADLREGNLNTSKVNVLFTMDDGYESWYTKGLQVLERYRVPALFFVPSGFVKCAGNVDAVHTYCRENLKLGWDSAPLTADMLKACAAHPLITIGGHTCNHRFLSQLSSEAAKQEVREDKVWLETELGAPVRVFAYPFGNHDASSVSAVSDAGYETAMTTMSDFVTARDPELLLPRSNHGTVHPFMLRLWILGAYDVAERAEDWVLRRK